MVDIDHNYYIIEIQMSAKASQSLGDLAILLKPLISWSFIM